MTAPHYLRTRSGPRSDAFAASSDLWLATARKLTHTLDGRHLAALLGLFFPFVGDVLGGLLGVYMLVLGWRRQVPRVVLARMALNTAIDTGLGAIPILGDVFDYWFKSNTRNVKLLERASISHTSTVWDGILLSLSLLALLVALCLPLVVVGGIIYWFAMGRPVFG